MNNVIIILLLLSVAIMGMWIYLIIFWMKDTKKNQAKRQINDQVAQLSKQAKIDAEERMAKAVEKSSQALQKSLLAQASESEKEFKKSIHEVTSKNIKEFSQSLEVLNTTMRDQLKILAESSQKQNQQLQESLSKEHAEVKAKAIAEIDNNIAEIMVSYLAEVAGDLDYYQQKDYLYSALEANKDAIKKDIQNAS